MLIAAGNIAFAQGYWVTGNRASAGNARLYRNPVVNSQVGGNVTFGTTYRQRWQAGALDHRECPRSLRRSAGRG